MRWAPILKFLPTIWFLQMRWAPLQTIANTNTDICRKIAWRYIIRNCPMFLHSGLLHNAPHSECNTKYIIRSCSLGVLQIIFVFKDLMVKVNFFVKCDHCFQDGSHFRSWYTARTTTWDRPDYYLFEAAEFNYHLCKYFILPLGPILSTISLFTINISPAVRSSQEVAAATELKIYMSPSSLILQYWHNPTYCTITNTFASTRSSKAILTHIA